MKPFSFPETFRNATRSMFWEHRHITKIPGVTPPFNLKEEDDEENGVYSLYKLYMSYTTEYEAALGILGSWEHWRKLCKCKWFQPYRNTWEEERLLREEAEAKKTLIEKARAGNITAARSLLAYEQKKKADRNSVKQGKGRPSNKQAPTSDRDDREIDTLLSRFKVVEGSKG